MSNQKYYPDLSKMGDPPPYEQAINPSAPPLEIPQPVIHHGHQTQRTIIINHPAVPRVHNSTVVHCPFCQSEVPTAVTHHSGTFAHLFALLLCIFGCCPFCLCPYCSDCCKDTVHRCPNCDRDLAVIRRL